MIIFDVYLTGMEALSLFCGSGMWIIFNYMVLNWVKIKNIERNPLYLFFNRTEFRVDMIVTTLELSLFWWIMFECFEVLKKF